MTLTKVIAARQLDRLKQLTEDARSLLDTLTVGTAMTPKDLARMVVGSRTTSLTNRLVRAMTVEAEEELAKKYTDQMDLPGLQKPVVVAPEELGDSEERGTTGSKGDKK